MGDEKAYTTPSFSNFHQRAQRHVDREDDHEKQSSRQENGNAEDFIGEEEGMKILHFCGVEALIDLSERAQKGHQRHEDED